MNILGSKFSRFNSLLLLVFICSCAKQDQTDYAHQAELKRYLLEEHSLQLQQVNHLLIIPVNSCSPCVKESIHLANQASDKLASLFVAEHEKDTLNFHIAENKQFLYDLNGKYNFYDLGIFGPTYMALENGHVITYINLDSEKARALKNDLKK